MATIDISSARAGARDAVVGQQAGGHPGAPPRKRHHPVQITANERARVFRQAKRHSVLVKILRVLCPVAALLSFGWYFTNKRIEIDVAGGKISSEIPTFSGDNLKMENPRYEGFTSEGGKFNVTAKTGYQDFRNPARIKLHTIDSHLTQQNEQWAHLVSDEGLYDTKADLLELSGNIKVTSSNGMTTYLKTASVHTKTQIVTSKDPVIVEMSNGTTVESDGMVLNAKTKEVTFEGNVRTHLVRDPATKRETGPRDRPAGTAATGAETDAARPPDATQPPNPPAVEPTQPTAEPMKQGAQP